MATFDFKKNLTKENLQSIFRLIDEDHNDVITKDEMQRFLNVNNENQILIEIFEEVDKNGDGVISLEEFMDSVTNLFDTLS